MHVALTRIQSRGDMLPHLFKLNSVINGVQDRHELKRTNKERSCRRCHLRIIQTDEQATIPLVHFDDLAQPNKVVVVFGFFIDVVRVTFIVIE